MKILMVCLGNICRSPLAEGLLRLKASRAGLSWELDSAGTSSGHHLGEAPHRLSQKVARLHGIDISKLKARMLTPEDFNRFDRLYAMSGDVLEEMKWIGKSKFHPGRASMLMDEAYPGQGLDIPDPWYGPEPGYHEVYRMIDQATEAIIKKYAAGNTPLSTLFGAFKP